MSSDASSSISVISVPVEVTGDGPTRSLGLMRYWFILEEGRREFDSEAETEAADDLLGLVNVFFQTLRLTYIGAN